MHELLTLEEKICDVSTKVIIKMIVQKLKINHNSSLVVVVCPFLGGF
jgi:hypothetical protein